MVIFEIQAAQAEQELKEWGCDRGKADYGPIALEHFIKDTQGSFTEKA